MDMAAEHPDWRMFDPSMYKLLFAKLELAACRLPLAHPVIKFGMLTGHAVPMALLTEHCAILKDQSIPVHEIVLLKLKLQLLKH